VGEIWVSGPSVASGYWDRPADTQLTFRARLAGEHGTFLRTGDLGFMLDGELFVTGRLKDLIIVDGTNHYPQDIEQTAGRSHPALKASDCAAFAVDVAGAEALVVVAALQRSPGPDGEDVKRAIRTAVSEQHALRVHDVMLVQTGSIPRTASGKIRRHACRAAYLARTLAAWETT
jgi:acyl-CoA synthetase (AMP-forming)/AMP-acid ligase II